MRVKRDQRGGFSVAALETCSCAGTVQLRQYNSASQTTSEVVICCRVIICGRAVALCSAAALVQCSCASIQVWPQLAYADEKRNAAAGS